MQPAGAVCGQGDREQFFVRALNNDGQPITRRGTLSRILMRNRDLDPDCPANYPPTNGCPPGDGWDGAATLSTAHMRSGLSTSTDQGKWIEIGWVELWHSADTSSQSADKKDWYLYTSKARNFDCQKQSLQLATNLDPGNDDIWRISATKLDDGTTDWSLAVNFVIEQGYYTVETYNTEWDTGVPMAETERFGNDTCMTDAQYNLQWKTSSGWESWQRNDCWEHTDLTGGEWYYDWISDTEVHIREGSAGC